MAIYIEGNIPLQGTVTLSGAKNSAIKLIFASLFSNGDVILNNVPRLDSIQHELEIIKSLGATYDWLSSNKLIINSSGLKSYELSQELASNYRTSFLIAGPLLYRFGRVSIPKLMGTPFKPGPINRIIYTWKTLGFRVEEDDKCIKIFAENPRAAELSFKSSTHTGTDNAIMSSLFLEGETIINNASEEPEIDDLIDLCNALGGNVTRTDSRTIKVQGSSIFNSAQATVQPDKYESALFATLAIITKGNIVIKGIKKQSITAFVNFLSKINANYEIHDNELRVWETNNLNNTTVTVGPSPGFVHDWQSLATLILTQASGISYVHDTVYPDRFDYTRDLNRFGADIELIHPSSIGIIPVLSDDSYDFKALGEPFSLAKIAGPSKLHAEKIHILDPRYANVLVLAALCAEGKTELHDYKVTYEPTENLFDKLLNLGAKISKD